MTKKEYELSRRLVEMGNSLSNATDWLELFITTGFLSEETKKHLKKEVIKNRKLCKAARPTDLIDEQMKDLKEALDSWQ